MVGTLPDPTFRAWHVACGSNQSFVIDQRGRVYAWGDDCRGQLGLDGVCSTGSKTGCVLKPTFVTALKGNTITHIASGESQTLASTEDGKLLVWGSLYGNSGEKHLVMSPTVVEGMPLPSSLRPQLHNSRRKMN